MGTPICVDQEANDSSCESHLALRVTQPLDIGAHVHMAKRLVCVLAQGSNAATGATITHGD